VSLLLLVPDALRGQANSGRALGSASFSETQRARYPTARMPDADSAESAGALYATAPTLAASLPKGPGASREIVACDTP
jgi:hypothetical protein